MAYGGPQNSKKMRQCEFRIRTALPPQIVPLVFANGSFLRRLKLQFYRSLRIDINQDNISGEITQAIVRSADRGDVNIIDLRDDRKASEVTNLFWQSL